jgi:hypothetical protein
MSQPPDVNPYAPSVLSEPLSQGPSGEHAPSYQLYSVAAITLAGFLGTLLSACVLIGLNYLRLRKGTAGWAMIGLGMVTSVLNFALAFSLPEDGPNWPFYVGHTVLSYALAVLTQQPALTREHQQRGGRLASIWWAVGISILVSIVQVVILLIVVEVVPEEYLEIDWGLTTSQVIADPILAARNGARAPCLWTGSANLL